ncbi:M24 family metallopeptidase, partial [Pseudomonas aeruginosa]|uniref:M24 family metallopeptidase n=1 Tax=Pseudomonas aeruginosa TaxID=287 RepID=UPI00211A8BEF
ILIDAGCEIDCYASDITRTFPANGRFNPEQKAIDDKVKQQVAKEEAERKQFCEETRNNLAQLKNNPRVRVDEGKGELRRLGEEERQERIAKAEKAIQENCR